MPLDKAFENLASRVTARFQAQVPRDDAIGTAVKPKSDPLDDDLPLGAEGGLYRWYEKEIKLLKSRKGLYAEYDEMDEEMPEFSSALDIYADNATRGKSDGVPSLVIRTDNEEASRILTELRDRLGLESILWTLARDIAKYGERAEEIVVNDRFDVTRLKPLPTQYIFPQLDEYGRFKKPWAYHQVNDQNQVVAKFREWQVLYFANKKSRADTTGRGIGYSARKAFKQLRLMEDAIVIARLTRAHNRLAYLVDTDGLTPAEAQKHLNKVKAALRRRRIVDPVTNKMNLDYNPLSVEEDVYVAVKEGSKADVKVLQGDLTVGNIDDLLYFQQKAFTSFKVPKTYLSHDKETRTRAVITEQDIQFARSVRRHQYILQGGLKQLCDFQLAIKGVDPRTVSYTIGLPPISVVDELRTWQTEQLKMLVAQMFKQTFWPDDEWIFKVLLGYDDEQVAELLKGQQKPDKYNGLYQAPKVGTVGKPKEEVARLIAQLPDDEFEAIIEASETLRLLTNWELEGIRNGFIRKED